MTKDDWQINIDNLSTSVAKEYGTEVVNSVFERYGATCFEDLDPVYYPDVFGDLTLLDSDQ